MSDRIPTTSRIDTGRRMNHTQDDETDRLDEPHGQRAVVVAREAAFTEMGCDGWLASNADPDEAWATFMGDASGVAL